MQVPLIQKSLRPPSAPATRSVTVQQALEGSPALARLADLVRQSTARLDAIQSLIPPPLRASVKAGPLDGKAWCLLVTGNAAAAKIRQLLPMIMSRLSDCGLQVTGIRLKILTTREK
jgi:hypothetical protein